MDHLSYEIIFDFGYNEYASNVFYENIKTDQLFALERITDRKGRYYDEPLYAEIVDAEHNASSILVVLDVMIEEDQNPDPESIKNSLIDVLNFTYQYSIPNVSIIQIDFEE